MGQKFRINSLGSDDLNVALSYFCGTIRLPEKKMAKSNAFDRIMVSLILKILRY